MSASSVPFTPSSPLLSCSQEGSRHTVTFPSPGPKGQVRGCVSLRTLTSPTAPFLLLQSKLSRHGSGADSDYENTQSGDPLLG